MRVMLKAGVSAGIDHETRRGNLRGNVKARNFPHLKKGLIFRGAFSPLGSGRAQNNTR